LVKRLRHFLRALSVGVGMMAVYLLWFWLHALDPGPDTYQIKPGMTLRAFALELKARNVLPESHSFALWAWLRGHSRNLKSGEYRFAHGINAAGILEQVVAGRVVEYPVVLVEGWTFRQFLAALAAAPHLTHTLTGLSPGEIMTRLGHPGEHPEGRFFPDTYHFSAGQNDQTVLARAYERMQARLKQEWDGRDPTVPYKNPYEALIMASIVEKETGRAGERRQIAGVFVNRLRRPMKLQTDPTVIYGLGEKFDGNLRLRDLRHDTPYNTYTRLGLPPTPIAMPGREALYAALHPAETRALYFVSRGDGSHVFSDTLVEHNNAVIKYQLNGKPKTFSSFAPTPATAPVPSPPP
jgi:UPF0755 protein